MNHARNLKILSLFCVALIIFAINWLLLDGKVYNRPLVFPDYYDPQNIEVVKDVYHPGETVFGKAAFCKTRASISATQWTLSNGKLTIYAVKEPRGVIPDQCYPEQFYDESGEPQFVEFPIETIPLDAQEGIHVFTGRSVMDMGYNRKLEMSYKTEPFIVEYE